MKVPSKFHPQRRFTYRGNSLTFNYVYRLKSNLALCPDKNEKEFSFYGQYYRRVALLEKGIET
jgi:hypothetical protein